MDRPHLLLVTGVSELEWQIKPLLEEWADVAAYDPPGVGESLGEWSVQASADRGLEVADERGWKEFVLVADGWGSWYAPLIIAQRPEAIRGFALGHAALSARMTGDRPVRNPAVWDALLDLIAQGQQQFARHAIPQFTRDGLNERVASEILDRAPMRVFERILGAGTDIDYNLEPLLRPLGLPLLFAQHKDCLLFTDEGFADAVAAFPEARTCVTEGMCSGDPVFAEAVKEFCDEIYA